VVSAHLDAKESLGCGQVSGLIRLICHQEMQPESVPTATLQREKQQHAMKQWAKQGERLNEEFVQRLVIAMPRIQVTRPAALDLAYLVVVDLPERVLWEANEAALIRAQTFCQTKGGKQTKF